MFDLDATASLSSAEAEAALARDGANELPEARRRTLSRAALDVVREPMTALLVACGAIYLVLGDAEEAAMLLGFVGLIAAITLYQERKTERALDALRELASPRALVIRDGGQVRVAGREVVRGDLLVVSEGDRVAADGVILSTSHCTIDESLLTGEAVPVAKAEWDGRTTGRPSGDPARVYAGTLVVGGAAIVRVAAIGAATELGRIGRALAATPAERTGLERESQALVWRIALGAGVLSAAVVASYAVARGDWLGGLLAGLTLAMAILPNELPVVITVFLALGAWRLSRRRVLTRRIPAVEALGAVTVLCVDKTGTLTENRMSVHRVIAHGERFALARLALEPLPEPFHTTIEYAVLASRADPFDPMEVAFHQLATRELAGTEHLHPRWQLVREYPLRRERLAVLQIWRTDAGDQVVAAKGAPEAIARLCQLDDAARAALAADAQAMADDGLRVLAVARGALAADAPPPDELGADPGPLALTLTGLVGLADPVRAAARAAVDDCRTAGIRVVMISGDYPATARSVAAQVGLPDAPVLTGDEVAALDDDALRARLATTCVLARTLPEHKLRIVRALAAAGEVVAMTGDGVNDAPALKAAHVGIAMGGRGTDVAREAAQLVLLDDDFASLVDAIRTGRRIYDNLRGALAYLLSVHLPIVALTVVPILVGWPLVLLPIHVAFLHLIIDPACSVVFEAAPARPDVMRRPPRPASARLFDRRLVTVSAWAGGGLSAVVLAAFAIAQAVGGDPAEARALTFTILVAGNLALIGAGRDVGARAGGALAAVAAGTLAFLAVALYLPPARALFRFAVLHGHDLAICAGATAVVAAWAARVRLIPPAAARATPPSASSPPARPPT